MIENLRKIKDLPISTITIAEENGKKEFIYYISDFDEAMELIE